MSDDANQGRLIRLAHAIEWGLPYLMTVGLDERGMPREIDVVPLVGPPADDPLAPAVAAVRMALATGRDDAQRMDDAGAVAPLTFLVDELAALLAQAGPMVRQAHELRRQRLARGG